MKSGLTPLLVCPLCEQKLEATDIGAKHPSWRCINGHQFDQAKQGYINLLPVQKKRSKQPGDDKAMVQSRRRFLALGHYQPIIDTLYQLLPDQCQHLIDIGCGEGYYTAAVAQYFRQQVAAGNKQDDLSDADIIGIDISKDAIRTATQQKEPISWLVASGAQPPLRPKRTDLLISLFTPLMTKAYDHMLTDDGQIILVHTGPKHLLSMREVLYSQLTKGNEDEGERLIQQMASAGFRLLERRSVEFSFTLANESELADLLAMTPHYWRATPERKQHLLANKHFTNEADVRLYRFARAVT